MNRIIKPNYEIVIPDKVTSIEEELERDYTSENTITLIEDQWAITTAEEEKYCLATDSVGYLKGYSEGVGIIT